MLVDKQNAIALGLSVLDIESKAILNLKKRIDQSFVDLCQAILDCQGRVIVMGMGKSGHIGKKIASTLASTGTPAFFIHPAEASHGDLGMITKNDLVIALSYSGETEELIKILPRIQRLDIQIAALTGSDQSTLAQCASIHISIDIQQEACPLGLAPTASSTALLAMGDALALAVLDARGFTAEDFAHSHPGGRLGTRLHNGPKKDPL
jgi:arabinose-5-phosphate isomerase